MLYLIKRNEYESVKQGMINYSDVTDKWLDSAIPNSNRVLDAKYFEALDGTKYYVDNKNVVLDYSSKEKEIAQWLEGTFGGELYMLPRINKPDEIQTSDYLFRNNRWDLKTIVGSSKQALYHAVYKKRRQANNFIFDISFSKFNLENIRQQVDILYKRTDISFIDEVIIKKGYDFLVFKRK